MYTTPHNLMFSRLLTMKHGHGFGHRHCTDMEQDSFSKKKGHGHGGTWQSLYICLTFV